MDNQTTLEEPISLRDTIENAIESTESAVTENTTSQDAVESDKTSQNASKELTEPSDDNVVETDTNVAEINTKPRPSSWKKDYEEHWGKLDPTLQDYIQQREADYAKGVSTYKNQWDMAQPLVHAIEPFMPLLQEHSIEPST
jgi:hypothetical protein